MTENGARPPIPEKIRRPAGNRDGAVENTSDDSHTAPVPPAQLRIEGRGYCYSWDTDLPEFAGGSNHAKDFLREERERAMRRWARKRRRARP